MSIPEELSLERPAQERLQATSGILYVRASLKPFARHLKRAGGIDRFLNDHFSHQELLVPYFMRARPFWERPRPRDTNSGSLGKMVAKLEGAMASHHPSHRFAGIGRRVIEVLRQHDENTSCFYPVGELARRHDFSMLLLGCVCESPGFSTVHAVQQELGLTRKHLDRFLLRWDCEGGAVMTARESPGCSASFGKFYSAYEGDGNLMRGDLYGTEYLFIPSARRAMASERAILAKTPRFVECGRPTCLTCRLRLY